MKGEQQGKPLTMAFQASATKTSQKKSSRKRDAASSTGTHEKSKRVKIAEDNVNDDKLIKIRREITENQKEIDRLKDERNKVNELYDGKELADRLNCLDTRISTETAALTARWYKEFHLLNQSSKPAEGKWFNDPVHGNIVMEDLCLAIIDTPEYQRLQGMKQLGVCDRVYRGATHTRFEHSLGVAHLAGKLASSLRKNQPRLGITDEDVLCVKIAGLCHDLGHGPYSHLYDGVFIRRMHPNGIDKQGKKWRHEDGSVLMFNHLLEVNRIDLEKYGLSKQVDCTHILTA